MAGSVSRQYIKLLPKLFTKDILLTERSCVRNFSKTNSVITTKQKHLYLIGINRPEERNVINHEVAEQLKNAFEAFENDDELYVAVLYGKGGNFCYGYDFQDVASEKSQVLPDKLQTMVPTRKLLKKPVVAAINGYAVAGGFELALWCDLRVVEETAVMGFSNRRFEIPTMNSSAARLPQLIGLSRALDIILTGRLINEKEAFEIGLATKITACGTAIGNAISLANSLCKFPQECLRADRWSAYHAANNLQSLEEALMFEIQNSSHVLQTESIKGAEKFVQGIGKHGTFHLDSQEKDVS